MRPSTELKQQQKLEKIIEYAKRGDIYGYDWLKEEEPCQLSILFFNHDFAKAIWGEKKISQVDLFFRASEFFEFYGKVFWEDDHSCYEVGCGDCGTAHLLETPRFIFYLQQIVLIPEEDRIDYIWWTISDEMS